MEKQGAKLKVSVIIPVYNTEAYLRECLDSIVNQTLRDIEIICINDGSTDNSLVILEEYALRDSRIQIHSQENKGLAATRNVGISHAKGEYIYYIDSDDALKPEALSELYQFSRQNNLDMLFFDAEVRYEDDEAYASRRGITENYYARAHDYSAVSTGPDLFAAMMENDEYRCNAGVQFSKAEHIQRCGLRFYKGILHEDDLYSFLCIMQASRAAHLRKPFWIRRVRRASIMTSGRGYSNFYGYLIGHMNMQSFAQKQDYPHEVRLQVDGLLGAIWHNIVSIYSGAGGADAAGDGSGADKWLDSLSPDEREYAMRLLGKQTALSAPLLTVVCLAYNHEKFIRDALDSFVAQKTSFRFEVIVSDDASTDGTQEIIAEYARKYEHIRPILRRENLGVEKNYLHTLSGVRSKYVIYNEGDDYFTDPYKLQKQVDFLESHPDCSICYHPVAVHYEDGSRADEVWPSPEHRFNKTELCLDDILIHNIPSTNTVMYRWRFKDENLLDTFPTGILPGDYYMHLLHAKKGNIGFIDEIMSVYRRHSGGIWWSSTMGNRLYVNYYMEMANFYFSVYKNIADESESYYTNIVVPKFSLIASSLCECGETEKLTALINEYRPFIENKSLQAYLIIAEQQNQIAEQQNQINALTSSVTYRARQKLSSISFVKRAYLICKKIYKYLM